MTLAPCAPLVILSVIHSHDGSRVQVVLERTMNVTVPADDTAEISGVSNDIMPCSLLLHEARPMDSTDSSANICK